MLAGSLVAVVVLAGGGFFAWQTFMAEPPPPPPVVKKTPAAPKATPAAPTPSDALNKVANAPAQAVKQAQEAVARRRDSGQTPVDDGTAGTDVPDRSVVSPGAPAPKAPTATTGSRTVAPGVAATTALQAGAEASLAFRNFVSGAKISGVITNRAIINGRLTRTGEVVDSNLGVTFEGYDTEAKQLLFKDRNGALVARRYP